MAWDSSTKILTKPFTKIAANGQGDLQNALSRSAMSHIQLIGDVDGNGNPVNKINISAKYKPFQNTTAVFSTSGVTTGDRQTARESANYGITIPECTTAQLLTADWTYNKPDGTSYPYRALDFDGYYSDAPITPACCVTQGPIVANVINSNAASPTKFYLYQKTGKLKDMPISEESGIGTTAVGRSTTQIDAICDLSDINVAGGTIYSKTNPYLGLALYQGTTFKKFVPCASPLVASQSIRVNDMFIMSLSDFSNAGVANGTYTGIACVRYGSSSSYKYAPLPKIPFGSGVTYQNTFEVRVGGQEMYDSYQVNVKENGTPSAATSGVRLRTSSSTVYVTIKVHNDSGIVHDSDPSSTEINKWMLVTNLNGNVVVSGQSSQTPVNRNVTSTPYSYPAGMHMEVDGDILISFQITNCWSPTAGQSVSIDSGSITLTCNLYYGSTSAPFDRPTSGQLALEITYGT